MQIDISVQIDKKKLILPGVLYSQLFCVLKIIW